jgi:hypothetical protein
MVPQVLLIHRRPQHHCVTQELPLISLGLVQWNGFAYLA